MNSEHRKRLSKLKSESMVFASKFNQKCDSFFNEISIKSSCTTDCFATINDIKLKSYDEFFDDAKISKNACKSIFDFNRNKINLKCYLQCRCLRKVCAFQIM
jgi:hypothetical protein